jgi:hypothetical protein
MEVSIDVFTLYFLELVRHKRDLGKIQLDQGRHQSSFRNRHAPSPGKPDVEKHRASQTSVLKRYVN